MLCWFILWKVYARKEALKGGLDKTVSLQKDLSEMHEWMTQAEEEYLERDFEYKTPDELQTAVEEMKVKENKEKEKDAALLESVILYNLLFSWFNSRGWFFKIHFASSVIYIM